MAIARHVRAESAKTTTARRVRTCGLQNAATRPFRQMWTPCSWDSLPLCATALIQHDPICRPSGACRKSACHLFAFPGSSKEADDGEAKPLTQRWPPGASQVTEDVANDAGSEKPDPAKTMAAQVGSAWAPVISRSSKPVVVPLRATVCSTHTRFRHSDQIRLR